MADDFSDLPKALVYTCIHDVLHNDGELYAQRLQHAGNNVTYYHNRAGFHILNSFRRKILDVQDATISNGYIRDYIKENL